MATATAQVNKIDAVPDADVVSAVLNGAQDDYALLVERYQDTLYRYALGMIGDPDAAADLVQDSFVRGYTRLPKCQDRAHFGGWIFRIMRNACLDYLKQPRRREISLEGDLQVIDARTRTDSTFENKELATSIETALAQLPELLREAFLLKHVEELSYEEMEEVLGASVSALRMRVLRARDLLKVILAEGE